MGSRAMIWPASIAVFFILVASKVEAMDSGVSGITGRLFGLGGSRRVVQSAPGAGDYARHYFNNVAVGGVRSFLGLPSWVSLGIPSSGPVVRYRRSTEADPSGGRRKRFVGPLTVLSRVIGGLSDRETHYLPYIESSSSSGGLGLSFLDGGSYSYPQEDVYHSPEQNAWNSDRDAQTYIWEGSDAVSDDDYYINENEARWTFSSPSSSQYQSGGATF